MPSTPASESTHVGSTLEIHHLEAAAVIPIPVPHDDSIPSSPQTAVPDDQQLASIALVLISIQVQFLMSASMASATVPRTILACGIVLELFGVLISLLSPYQGHFIMLSPPLSYIVQAALMFPIIFGVFALTTTTIMIVVNIRPAAAIACSSPASSSAFCSSRSLFVGKAVRYSLAS